jgi:transcriptional regulator with XRE-family HTH domain
MLDYSKNELLEPDTIKKNLLRILKEKKITPLELEKKIFGKDYIKKRMMKNIINNKSQYPNINKIKQISNSLNISMEELISKEEKSIDYNLFCKCTEAVTSYFKKTELYKDLPHTRILNFISKTYLHLERYKIKEVDDQLVEMIINQ